MVEEKKDPEKATFNCPLRMVKFNNMIDKLECNAFEDLLFSKGSFPTHFIYKEAIVEPDPDDTNFGLSRGVEAIERIKNSIVAVADSFQDAKSQLAAYENLLFGKIRDGILVAASHPLISCGVATGLGFLVLKKPRNFFYHKTIRLFMNEESLLSKADAKVKKLRQSIDRIKVESERLEKRTLQAEGELLRGRTKLRQAGKQIEGVIQSAHTIERKARGLKDILADLPRREASQFRTQVSNLASEAKKERIALGKEVSKISNYGISV